MVNYEMEEGKRKKEKECEKERKEISDFWFT